MTKIAADETKRIPRDRWEEWCDTFSDGNQGRVLHIESVSEEAVVQPVTTGTPLVAIDYDPAGKGDDMVISYGDEADPSRRIIHAPAALWQGQDENGVVVGLEIEHADGQSTVVTFI